MQESAGLQSDSDSRYPCNSGRPSSNNSFLYADEVRSSCSYFEMPSSTGASGLGGNNMGVEGPSEEDSCYQLNNNSWLCGDQRNFSSMGSSCNLMTPNEWERCNFTPLSWGGRTVGRREVKSCLNAHSGVSREDYDAFANIFEGGSLLYCNMSFDALLSVRKQLEEMGFPCKAVNDGLWLQVCNYMYSPFCSFFKKK